MEMYLVSRCEITSAGSNCIAPGGKEKSLWE
jgi:hypothetical protein